MKTLLLSQSEVKQLLDMNDFIDIVEKTYHDFGTGKIVNPVKVRLDMGEWGQYPFFGTGLNAMPAYVGWQDIGGLKWAGSHPRRVTELGKGVLNALILLVDPRYVSFLAVVDGAYITNMRTGAQSAVTFKHINKQRSKSIRMAMYGCGTQARGAVRAMSCVTDIERLNLYDIRREAAEQLKAEMAAFVKGDIVVCDTAEQAAQGIEVVVSAVRTRETFFKYEWFKPGMIILSLDTYQIYENDCILKADKIIVDHVGQCLHRGVLKNMGEAGRINESSIFATCGDLVAGNKEVGDYSGQRILVGTIGTGAIDVAAAATAYKKALNHDIGQTFSFDM